MIAGGQLAVRPRAQLGGERYRRLAVIRSTVAASPFPFASTSTSWRRA